MRSAFVVYREDASVGERSAAAPIRIDSRIVQWLNQTGRVLVKEEAKLNPEIAAYFEAAENELDAIKATIIVPLKIEGKLTGILLVGEKLSGDIFDDQELEVLGGPRQPGRDLAGERATLRGALGDQRASSCRRAGSSPSSWPACRTSCGRRSTRSSDSRRCC